MGRGKRKGDSGEGDRKKGKYFHQTKKDSIPLGSCGFLVSCDTGREFRGSREVINLLTEYYERLYPSTSDNKPAAEGGKSIDTLIADEVADLKDRSQRPFTYVKTGISGLLYIEAAKSEGAVARLSDVAWAIMKDVAATKQSKSRYCLRILPVDVVCNANLAEIKQHAETIVAPHFPGDADATPVQFAVNFEHRASKQLDRMEVINAVINSIQQPPHKVNLTTPDKTIIVQLVKSYCLMGVAPHYKQLAKYNMRELCKPGSDDAEATEKEGAAGAAEPAEQGETAGDGGAAEEEPLVGESENGGGEGGQA